MKMKQFNILIILAVFAFFAFSSFSPVHKFYVSVTEIELNPQSQSLQIISRVFTDDLENVLRQRFDDNIRLGKGYEAGKVNKVIPKYLDQKMRISLDGKSQDLKFIGMEYDNDMTVFYIEIENVRSFQNIKIMNALLTDLFDDQKNLVHVENKDKIKSLILARGKEEDVIKF